MPGRRTPAAHENDLPGAGTDDSGHRASVLEARDQFLATRSNKPVGVRDLIGESWLRSRRWAVAADRLVPHPVNRDLDPPIVDIARPILQRLAGRLAGQQIGLLLTDADAVLLLRFAKDPTFRRRLDRAASLPGYSWSEQSAGTNAVGTALHRGAPTLVAGGEHYVNELRDLSCVGVPLGDPVTGQVLGLLDLCCPAVDSGPMMAAVADLAADKIQNVLSSTKSDSDRRRIWVRDYDTARLKRLYETERRNREVAETLSGIAAQDMSTLDGQDVLARIMTAAAPLLPWHAAWVLAREPDQALKVIAVQGDVDQRVVGMDFVAPSDSVLHLAFCGTMRASPHFPALEQMPGHQSYAGSWIAVPAARGTYPRVIVVVTSRAPGRYGPKRAAIAQKILGQAATIFEQALIFRETRSLACTDPLTGLANRRAFFGQAGTLVEKHITAGQPLAALMTDIDGFKGVNDRHGHAVGDLVLARIGEFIQNVLRPHGVTGRVGGEEFAAVLDCHEDAAVVLAERLRNNVSTSPVCIPGGSLAITVSVGVAMLTAGDRCLDDLLLRADAALYRAKESGRNRTVVAGEPSSRRGAWQIPKVRS
ncbi:diguanylate cyclase [Parafrankia sp. BMG5.11]|nr:diguanylate cyclase [Parafrankia sp. BMG5.11]